MNEENTTPVQEEVKTFTQDEVNRIIGDRLAKEKAKAENVIAQKEEELVRRELLLTAKERLVENNLPPQLIDAINVTDAAALARSIELIKGAFGEHRTVKLRGLQPGENKGETPENSSLDNTIRGAMGLT